MFDSVKQWWANKQYKRVRTKKFRHLYKKIDQMVFSGKFERVNLAPWSDSQWKVTFPLGEYQVVYTHMIRGSLVEIFLGEDEVIGYVDQQRQWSIAGLTWNDVTCPNEHLEVIYESIK